MLILLKMPSKLTRVNLGIRVFAQELVRLSDKLLREFETQNGRIKPIEIGMTIIGHVHKSIQQFFFTTGFVTKVVFFLIFDQG